MLNGIIHYKWACSIVLDSANRFRLILVGGWPTPFKHIIYSQLGWWLFPTEWENKSHVPNHEPAKNEGGWPFWNLDDGGKWRRCLKQQIPTWRCLRMENGGNVWMSWLEVWRKATKYLKIFQNGDQWLKTYGFDYWSAEINFQKLERMPTVNWT